MSNACLVDNLKACIGQTVTIFTTSGGLSGDGFTGVLSSVCNGCIKLIISVGGPPACPIGSSCGGFNNWGQNWNNSNNSWNNWGGSWGSGNWGGGNCSGGNCGCGAGCCRGNCGNNNCGCGNLNWIGSVAEIPICAIACFTRNAI